MSNTIQLNGKPHTIEPDTSVADLVAALGLADQAVAVEVNKKLVTKSRHTETPLSEGDQVEVVTLVGGG